jgi:hypothetical protein
MVRPTVDSRQYLGGFVISDLDFASGAEPVASTPPVPKRSRVKLVVIILLSVLLAAAISVLVVAFLQLKAANARIQQQQQQIRQQQNLIDEKQTFGAAMQKLMETAHKFDGVPMAAIVPIDGYQAIATREWVERESASSVGHETETVKKAQARLDALLKDAATQAATNTTGTAFETTIDQLGQGFVSSSIDDVHGMCSAEALACVDFSDPYTVHFDVSDNSLPWMTDFVRTGVAYHEFAHVLQATNPTLTATALQSFGGDRETMADCFALTYVPGWTLDQQIYVSSYEYYDVSIGYGYTCNADQMQVIRDWYQKVGVHARAISQ